MEKTLYISDLDGTLLDNSAAVSKETAAILNRLIPSGLCFTVATARSVPTLKTILSEIPMRYPAIVMNGACTYDFSSGQYGAVQLLPKGSLSRLFSFLEGSDLSGSLFLLEQGQLHLRTQQIVTPRARQQLAEKTKRYGAEFVKVMPFSACLSQDILYFSISETFSRLSPLFRFLKQDKSLHLEFYQDTYESGIYYLEVCAKTASKYNGAMALRKTGFDKIISFGDNLNDLPLFRASDLSYAVANAHSAVLRAAHDVIGRNTEDGVARFLEAHFKAGPPVSPSQSF